MAEAEHDLSIAEVNELFKFSVDEFARWRVKSDWSPTGSPDTVAEAEAEGWWTLSTALGDEIFNASKHISEQEASAVLELHE